VPVSTVWYTRCPVPTALGLAIRLGWLDEEFAAEGIEVRSLAASPDRAVRQSHFEHTQAASFRHGCNVPPLVARSRGADVRLVGVAWVDEYQPVLVLPESGVGEVADLRGKRLAVPRRPHDAVDFWRASVIRGFRSALRAGGLTDADVEYVDIPVQRAIVDDVVAGVSERGSLWGARHLRGQQREEAFALIRGEVDAVFTRGELAVYLEPYLGARAIIDLGAQPDRSIRVNNCTPLVLTASGTLVEEQPDLVARVLARALAAAAWAREHPAEASALLAAEVGVAEEDLDYAFGPRLVEQLALDLAPESLAALEEQKRFLLEEGFLDDDVDVEAWAAVEPLDDAYRRYAEGVHAGLD
jgi:ABC-type nitrate/sulfonate/bicarbonate transport system substrate-binding protein